MVSWANILLGSKINLFRQKQVRVPDPEPKVSSVRQKYLSSLKKAAVCFAGSPTFATFTSLFNEISR